MHLSYSLGFAQIPSILQDCIVLSARPCEQKCASKAWSRHGDMQTKEFQVLWRAGLGHDAKVQKKSEGKVAIRGTRGVSM